MFVAIGWQDTYLEGAYPGFLGIGLDHIVGLGLGLGLGVGIWIWIWIYGREPGGISYRTNIHLPKVP